MENCKKHLRKACTDCTKQMEKGMSYGDLKRGEDYTAKSEINTFSNKKKQDDSKFAAKKAGAMAKSEPELNTGMSLTDLRKAENSYSPEAEVLAKTEALAATGNKELIQKALAKIEELKKASGEAPSGPQKMSTESGAACSSCKSTDCKAKDCKAKPESPSKK